ncbi:MAG: metallophosphoesterase [Bulleidia sp.]
MKTKWKTCRIGIIATSLLCGCVSVSQTSSKQGVVKDRCIERIAVMSDTHLQTGELSDGISYINSVNNEIIEAGLDQIDADLLILCGDNTNSGKMEEHEQLLDLLETVNTEVIVVPGNHDLGGIDEEEFVQLYSDYGYGSCYSRDSASMSYSVMYENLMVVVLDTENNQDGRTGIPAFDEKTVDWLQEQLEISHEKEIPVICAGHYPILTRQTGEFRQKTRIVNLLNAYDVRLYFAGHLHYHAVSESGKMKEAVVPQLTSYPVTYETVEINEYSWTVESAAVDVEQWAEEHQSQNENLRQFNVWMNEQYRRKCEDVVSVLAEDQNISEEDLRTAQEFFYRIMKYRSDGTLYNHQNEILNHEGYDIFLNISEGTIWHDWVPLVLLEANADTMGFTTAFE